MHFMKLADKPFCLIKKGLKTVELRLYDEKRRLLKIGDMIEFINIENGEKIRVKIINLHKYNNFLELYDHFDKVSLGYEPYEEPKVEDMDLYYSREEQEKYGVLGIEIELLF